MCETMLLSSFFQQQINRRGEVIDVHNTVQVVTVGIACTSHHLTMPDVMLLAQPAVSCMVNARNDQDTQRKDLRSTKSLELTRRVREYRTYAEGARPAST